MPSLIHISDLHRSNADPIDNDTLLAAIFADIDRFAALNEKPTALIVSGDLVQGVKSGTKDFAREMRDQYLVAFDLIERLCNELLEGDRSKVVIVPGNHDVCWNTSAMAMEVVAKNMYPKNLRQSLGERDGEFRWSWNERQLYRVSDTGHYRDRLAWYWDGIENFYRNTKLTLPLDRARGYQLYELFDGNLLVAAFESTHRNDHLRYEAELSTGVVSRCAMAIRKLGLTPMLLAAVWHHSINGAPNKEDYLNIEAIRQMAGLGFQLGFHGHQHLAESTDLAVSVGGGSTMCVVSAGSLCAGWNDLPRGTDRQYNLVRIDSKFENGTLHVREMAEGSQFVPRNRGRFIEGLVPLSWSPRVNVAGQPVASREGKLRKLTLEVEEANMKGQRSPATDDLIALRPEPRSFPRKVLLNALRISERWNDVRDLFEPSDDAEELAVLAEAAYQLGDIAKLNCILADGKLPPAYHEHYETRQILLRTRERR